jgi:hypothetical protein
MDKPYPTPRLAARNAAIHAAEAVFSKHAADIVGVVLRRAHGGDPVCLRLCLERALPAGRIPPAVDLAPGYDPANLNRAFHAVGDALDDGTINIRQAARVLDALGPDVRAREDVKYVRAMAKIEAGLAQTLAAIGMDHFVTVAPRGPGGILENHQTHTEETP